jgi:oligopeptide/dipeptide ABC transporter ATP-binding protein
VPARDDRDGARHDARLLIADEPTTGLDVSIAAQILDLLRDLGRRTGAAILLITHDLGVVAKLCDRVVVMHGGQTVEWAPVRELFHAPAHPYTRALMRSVPRVDRQVAMEPIPGSVPSLLAPPRGCRFGPRCDLFREACADAVPVRTVGVEHTAACVAIGGPESVGPGRGMGMAALAAPPQRARAGAADR